ncbi:MAG: acetyl-CoA carboxylase biotin carboxyl carrier protein subunit [Prolixibacteraceae bacterium]|nr:acetyl-CoA carboxylase biotin carboxyl carrier protein subunit [Prolixibacteraceae bacterium]
MKTGRLQKYVVKGTRIYNVYTRNFKLRRNPKYKVIKKGNGKYEVSIGKDTFSGEILHQKHNEFTVGINGNTYDFIIDREESLKLRAVMIAENGQNAFSHVRSPMPGKIEEIFVKEGSVVKKGEPLLILEAMKMQNQILSPDNAVVKAVHIKEKDSVASKQLLLELEKQ